MKAGTLSTLLASALLLAGFASMAADTHHCKSDTEMGRRHGAVRQELA
jgi:hypothetical protein